ncbi:MAG: ankyrin repeat domain-containing protein [Hyphomonadaceae bacterium]|nr:MAG: ankyrin [Caulobacteraceae bacterium]MBT9445296.1 ankyrin repeat domain-containing protein [Hyphomonadaceae bacterium]TPW07763.1 MAG: ankyrin [Alphaproteobacteria bacterium]
MEITFFPALGDAIMDGDLGAVTTLLAEHPETLHYETPFGSWLDLAASEGRLEIVRHLVEQGLDVNRLNHHDNFPICCAADSGDPAVVAYLLEHGARADLRGPNESSNPMFATIRSKSPAVARLLLDHGLDATIEYANGKNVANFALLHGAPEVAAVIAAHLAGGDPAKTAEILTQAQAVADRQGKPQPVRILPTLDDLAGE